MATTIATPAAATTYTETVPGGNGPIPNTYPPVGGTMFVLIGANGNIYYQFVNPSTQFRGFQLTGNPAAFRGAPTFQLGPTQALNCGTVSCSQYFGGSIVEGYARLTARDGDTCPASTGSSGTNDNFDYQDITFEVNGIEVGSLSDLPPNSVERTNFAGDTSLGFENCFRNQGGSETSTGWFDLTPVPGLLDDILTTGGTTPFITDTDGFGNGRGDNFWFFDDGNDATGTPEVAPGIEIVKTADRADYTAPGDIINYSFEVTNIGSVFLSNIVVTDSFITGNVSCPQTSLVSGASMTCTGQHVVTQQNVDDDIVFVNTAEVTATPSEGTLGNISGTLTIPGPSANNSMTLTKTPSKTTDVAVGETITYTYVVTNTGNITLDDVTVTDVHGGVGTLSAVTPSPVTLGPTQSQTFTATYVVEQGDLDAGPTIANTATATATPKRGTINNVDAPASISLVAPNPAATFSKLASPDADANEGDTITYTYTVNNTGNVTIDASIADVQSGTGSLSAISPATASIAPGASQDFTATYVVTQDDFDAGTNITNTATATLTPARGTLGDLTADEVVTIAAPAPAATMTKTPSPAANVEPGDTITYTYAVTNTGDVTLTGVSVSDVHNGTGSLSAITPASVDLAPGASQNFTATYVVEQGDQNALAPITNVATLNATPARGTLAPVTANASVAVIAPAPAATLTKTPSITTGAAAGDTITYTYVFANTGNVPLTNVSVSDVHNGTGTLSAITPASVATILPGADATFTATYVVTLDDIEAEAPITNDATGNATPAGGTLTAPTANASVALEPAAPAATMLKTASNTTGAVEGETITYSYAVENTGNVTLTGVSVSDAHSGVGSLSAITPASVDLAPGATQTFTATYVVQQGDIDAATDLTNTATLAATPAAGTLAAVTDDEVVTLDAPAPALTMTKTPSATTGLTEGQTITYTYAVENTGNVTITGVSVSDVHNGAGSLSAITPASVDLAPGASQDFTATYVVQQADIDAGVAITNDATADGTPASGVLTPATADASVTPETPAPAMTLVKTASDTTDVVAGQTITYSYAVENTGNVTISGVSISDTHSGAGSLSAITPASVDLLPGASQTFTATYVVQQADIDAATPITNDATANGTVVSGTLTPPMDSESVSVSAPAPASTFTKTASATTDLVAGQTITYSYVVTNTGNVTLSNVSVSDAHSGAGPLSAITPASVDLLPTESQTFTATYTVTQDDIDADAPITNTATLAATPAAGTLPPATADESVTTEAPVPAMTMTKTPSITTGASEGDTITYTYAVTNTGNVSMSAVSVSDAHSGVGSLSAITPASVDLAPGASQTFTATYVVQQGDIDAATPITNTASLNATPATGTLAPVTADASVDIDAPAPSATMVKTPSITTGASEGETITYTYDVTNTGNVTLTGVSVSDVHSGTGALSAITPASVDLAPGASQTFTATYVVTQADIDAATPITNDATLIATPAAGTLAPVVDDASVALDAPTPSATMVKTASQTVGVNAGDTITYSYAVENTGNVTLSAVSISDVHAGAGTLSAITPASVDLAPGATQTFTATYVVQQADIDAAAPITNDATLNATPASGTLAPVTDSESVTPTAAGPSLAMTKTADITSGAQAGDTITYSYLVTNDGNITVSGVSVTDVHAGAGTLSAITPASVDLAPGESQTFTATYVVQQADIDAATPITNDATADGTPASGTLTPATDNESVAPDAAGPNASFTKMASKTTDLVVGETITYTYAVTNTGNVTLTSVSVSDVHNGAGTLSAITPASVDLIPGASQDFTATYVVQQADIDAGVAITNTATLAATPAAGTLLPTTADESVTPATPNPEITLTKTPSVTANVAVGDVITYTYVAENTGNTTLADVSITDVHSGTGTLSAVSPANVASLAVGDSATFTATYTVTQGDIDAGLPITNEAVADATPPSGTYSPAIADATVTLDAPNPAIDVVKTASVTTDVAVGDVITYTYAVTNTGTVTLSNVMVSDVHSGTGTLSAITPANVASLAPGASASFSATYTVTQADIDSGAAITNTATVDATPSQGTLTPATDDASVTPETPAPSADFTKTASATTDLSVGEIITYTYVATNTGNVSLNNVSVSDVHSGTGTLSAISPASVATIPVGGSATFTATYEVTQADIDAGAAITNTATLSATPASGTLPPTTADETAAPDAPAPALTVAKTALDSDFAAVGDTLDYEYEVVNTGNVSVTALSVSDDKIASVTCPVTALAPGESTVCTATYTVTQDDLNAGSVTNIATTSATPAGGTLAPATDTATVNGTQSPALTVAKAALDSDFAAVGDVLDYEYTVTNTGNVEVTAISVADDKIASVSCPVTTLIPGASTVCTASYSVTQADIDAGSVTNVATTSGTPAGGTLAPATDTATVNGTQSPELAIAKTALSTDFAAVGDVLNYEYTVTNTGNVTITAAISVDDDKILPPSIVSCPSLPTGGLAPGASLTCAASYSVTQADLDAGEVTNIASATDGTTTSPTDSATVTGTQSPALSIAKAAVQSDFTAVGDILEYTYTVENIGNVAISAIAVSDDKIPAVSCDVASVGNLNGALDPAETVVCTGSYTVTQADLDAGEVTNIASASGTPAGGTLTPPTDTVTVDAVQTPSLTVAKTANETSFAGPGDVLTYEYAVENTGNVRVTDLAVADDKIATVTCPVTTLEAGESTVCTASYTVTQADIDAGDVTNIATVTATPSGGTLTPATDTETVAADQNPALETVKTATTINFELPGDITTYDYVVTNTGNVTITDPITVSDNRIASVSCPALPAGGLAPGASLTCTADYVVSQADLDAGSVTNLASATDGTTTSPQTSETIPADQNPALSVVKEALFTDFTTAGETVTYRFTVSNDGNVTITGTTQVMDDKIGTIDCFTGNLVPGGTQVCEADYVITQADVDAGFVTNQAFAENGPLVSAPVTESVTATQTPSLTFEKTALTTDFNTAGDVLDYELTVTNTGNVTLTGIAVTDDLTSVSCPVDTLAPAVSVTCTASLTLTQAEIDAGSVTNNASVSATPPSGAPITGADSATVTGSGAPGLRFEKRATRTEISAAGDLISFEFDLENTGMLTLSGLTITDPLISNVSCPRDTLAPGASILCTGTYTVTQADIDAGEVENTATVAGTLPDGSALPPQTDSVIVPATRTPSLSVVKSSADTGFDTVGDTLTYTFDLTNTGNVTITDIALSDDRIGTVSCPVTSLDPGESTVCTASDTVTQADIDAGAVTNIATVTGTPPAGTTLPPVSDTLTIDADLNPALETVKTASLTDVDRVGQIIDYSYVVTNTGNVTLTDAVTVADDKIASVSCPAIPAGGLAPGDSVTCAASYAVTQADLDAGGVTNIASSTSGTVTSPDTSVTVNATQDPSIAMTKTATPQSFNTLGQTVSYDYVITNTGNVSLTDAMSVSDDRISVSCPALPAGGLAPGASITCTGTDTVSQADLDAGQIENTATANTGGTSSAPVTEVASAVAEPALDLVKTAQAADFAAAGDLVSYDYVVTNTGNVTITDPITVSDDKIASVSCPALPGGTLAPGASLTCTATYAVTQADVDAGSVTNLATAAIPGATSPQASETVSAVQAPAIDVVKTALTSDFDAVGDVLSYQYQVRNTGNVTLTGALTVSDDRIAAVDCPALPMSGLAPGDTITCTATDLVTQADLDAGFVTNTASATDGTTTSPDVSETITADQLPSLAIVKRALEQTYTAPGQTISYEFDVTNDGNITITDAITVADDKIASVSCPALPAGGLVPGAFLTCTGTYQTTQADVDAGFVANLASASAGGVTSPTVEKRVFATRNSALEIEKNATSINFTLPGDITTYEYVVTNAGNVTVTDPITVSDNRIPNVVCPALPAGGLLPGASLTCTADYVVTQDNLDVGVVTNIATASSGTITSAPDSETVPANANPALEVRKSSDDTSYAAVGDVLSYEFEIENTGNVTLTGQIEVIDNRIGTIPCFVGNFVPGAIEVCTATYTVTQADIDAGEVTNDAYADHPRASSPPVFVTIPAVQNPDLSLAKSAGSASFAAVGETITYTYTATNTGNVTLVLPVEIFDDRIANVTCPALPAGGLAPGASLTCTGTDTVSQADIDAGDITNVASGRSGDVIADPVSETVNADQTPSISLVKTARSNDFAVVGDTLSYDFIVTNTGNVTLTDAVTITDDRIGAVACPALPAGGLAPNATLLCQATDTVTQADLDAGSVTNTASATSGPTTSTPVSETVTGTQTPALSMNKTALDSAFAAAGDTIRYAYAVTNTGNVTVTDPITVVDDKIASVSCPPLPAGGLVPGDSVTCEATYAVTQADVDAGSVTNLATASAGDVDSPQVSETVSADQAPSLSVDKRALTADFAAVGETLSYDYVVTNTGNVTLTNAISINDDRIPAVSCPALPSGGLLPGATLTCTATDTVTQADLDAGFVTNRATATDGTAVSPEVSATVTGQQTTDIAIDKIALSNDFAAVGDTLSYEFRVRNTGNVSITEAITVSDDKIGEVACPALPAGGLLPGATLSCTADYAVVQADLDAGEVTNIATARVGTGAPSAPDQVTISGTQEPALSVDKRSDATGFTAVGEIVSYTYVVTNTGNVTLTDAITVADDKIETVNCPALPAGGLLPGDSLTCAADYAVVQADLDAGFVTNVASAQSGDTLSDPATLTIGADQAPALTVEKTAVTDTFTRVGDTVSYTYVVTNTGNTTLTGPLSVADDKIADVICPAVPSAGLAPGESLTCAADYAVVQADLDAGEVTNLATASLGDVDSPEVSETVAADRMPSLAVTKSVTSQIQVGGPIYDVVYTMALENTGNVSLTDVSLTDDLEAHLSPATLVGSPVLDSTDFTPNGGFDGSSDQTLFTGGALGVGESGTITLSIRIDTTVAGPARGNTAVATGTELTEPVPSNDPTVTPGTEDDVNPTPLVLSDLDGDGAPDVYESDVEDRDGDGIPDREDYDPTGYFYCEENGNILSGGRIAVSGPAGRLDQIGTANNITIVEDGSGGFYQFYVTEPGRYVLELTYPTSGVPSTTRLPSPDALDVSTLLPANPAVLGSSEVGSTGRLADESEPANPVFYTAFDIEPGDPSVLMNNIPMRNCGMPAIELAKTVLSAPEVQADGRQQLTYAITASNTGETVLNDVQIRDDLGAVFGADRVEIASLTVDPADFTASASYDGVSQIEMLSAGQSLNAGESVTAELTVLVNPQRDGTFENNASVTVATPLDGSEIGANDTAATELLPLSDASFLRVVKTAQPRTVQIGDPVLYTVQVTNEGASTITDIDLIDRLPEGFAYVPGSARVRDAAAEAAIEPFAASRGQLEWAVNAGQAAPLDNLNPGESLFVTYRLLAGPNVEFGAHENQAFAQSDRTGTRSATASAVVDYIPEPSFDCTPVIGRVYDDVNQNGYPDDGEPGLPGVRLATVNGDIITTDEYGRYHIPCAIIPDAERGSNFLLKTDVRTIPLGYQMTTENPRVIRATRGKFAKINFGAAHRPTVRIDLFATDYEQGRVLPSSATRVMDVIRAAGDAERALIVYHALDAENVDAAQARLSTALDMVTDLSPSFDDISLEASWGDASGYVPAQTDTTLDSSLNGRPVVGEVFDRLPSAQRQRFVQGDAGLVPVAGSGRDGDDIDIEGDDPRDYAGLRGRDSSNPLNSDSVFRNGQTRPNGLPGRRVTGPDESPRPGRLLRWRDWGNSSQPYADTPEIETTVSALDAIKRLNVTADVVSDNGTREIRAAGYTNYRAFVERMELRVFEAGDTTRGAPLAMAPMVDGFARLPITTALPEQLQYVLRAYDAEGRFDETAPRGLILGDAEHDLDADGWTRARDDAYGQNTLRVDTIRVRGGAVRVYGRNVPGTGVTVMGEDIVVGPGGRFVSEQILPTGAQDVTIEAEGYRKVRSVDVKASETFYVGQVEATFGEKIDGSSIEDGRVAFYVRSKLDDRWAFTATADTGEAGLGDLFGRLDDRDLGQLLRRLDPDRYYPTYGDDSVIEQDAPTSGRIYARIERDDDYALWGNYRTGFTDTEFGRVRRTLYGAKLHWDGGGLPTSYGDDRTRVTAFVAEGGSRQGRDVLRGTGGSVYYLRRGDIAIGSEQVRIEVRDRLSDLVLEQRPLTYGTDYDIDFIQGRIILTQPLGSTQDDGGIFRDGSQSGDARFLVVDYEYTPVFGRDDDGAVYGARVSRWIGDRVKIGGTYTHSDETGAGSDLFGLDATLQLSAGTYLKAEYARTEGIGVQAFRSNDGGFTYEAQDLGGRTDDTRANGLALEAGFDLADIGMAGSGHLYYRERERGFAGYAEATNEAVEQFGGEFTINPAENLQLTARADIFDSALIGTNSTAELEASYEATDRLTLAAGLSYNESGSGLSGRESRSGTALGARVDYEVSDDTRLYAFGQVGIEGDNIRTTDRIGAGGEFRISKTIFAGGEVSTGEDGLGARASLRRELGNGDEWYVGYDLPLNSQLAANIGTLNVGTRQRFTDALSVYGEERMQFTENGLNGLTHAYGVDYKPGNWTIGLSGELGRVDQFDREAVSATIGFASERMKAGVSAEYRADENVDTGDKRNTWLLRSTARYLASDELTLHGKFQTAVSDQSRPDAALGPQSFNEAEFTEASVAAAYRPVWDDRFNLLGKFVWLEDLSPTSQRFGGETLNYRQKSHIASVDASYDIAPRWTLGGKYAYRAGEVTSNRESLDFTRSEAELAVIRLDFHATSAWDATAELRRLDIGNGVIVRDGGLAGIYRHVGDHAKVGVGATWGGIDERFVGAREEDAVGWFVNVVGKF